MDQSEFSLDVEQSIEVAASAEAVFGSLLSRLTDNNTRPDGVAMPMKMERQPGGRWYRDLGDDAGHLWGHVQVIKPPTLLEIAGPLFMSYPVSGHVQWRVTESDGTSTLTLRHRAFGLIEDEHREHASAGWQHLLGSVRGDCT